MQERPRVESSGEYKNNSYKRISALRGNEIGEHRLRAVLSEIGRRSKIFDVEFIGELWIASIIACPSSNGFIDERSTTVNSTSCLNGSFFHFLTTVASFHRRLLQQLHSVPERFLA
jgi:hypothetical protein